MPYDWPNGVMIHLEGSHAVRRSIIFEYVPKQDRTEQKENSYPPCSDLPNIVHFMMPPDIRLLWDPLEDQKAMCDPTQRPMPMHGCILPFGESLEWQFHRPETWEMECGLKPRYTRPYKAWGYIPEDGYLIRDTCDIRNSSLQ